MPFPVMVSHPSLPSSSSSSSSLLCFSSKCHGTSFRFHLLQIAHKRKATCKSEHLLPVSIFCSSQINVSNKRDVNLSSPFLCTKEEEHRQHKHQKHQEEGQSIYPKALFIPKLVCSLLHMVFLSFWWQKIISAWSIATLFKVIDY